MTVMVLGQNGLKPLTHCWLILSSLYCFQISTYPIKMLSGLPFILLLALFSVHSSDAKCCRHFKNGFCREMTGYYEYCCGNGACNIFCCNCAGGCRGDPPRGKRAVNDVDDLDHFANYDLNQDGVIDFSEANSKMGMYNIRYYEYIYDIHQLFLGGMLDNSTFYDLDLDMNGVISTKEFDKDLS